MAWHGWGLEDQDVVNPGDGRDGGPVGAYPGVWILVHLCKAGCVPPLSVSSQLEFKSPSRMVWWFG
jgi:hypothetical protein